MLKVTRKNAILLQCWECMGHYADGKQDCENRTCALYPFMPYKKKKPKLKLYLFSPSHKGKVRVEDTKRELTDEQKAEIAARLQKGKEND